MLDSFIIRKIMEDEERKRQYQQQPFVYIEEPRFEIDPPERKKEENEKPKEPIVIDMWSMSLKDNLKIKLKKVKPRNYLVVVAKFRNSSGPIKDPKKENNKEICRKKVINEEKE